MIIISIIVLLIIIMIILSNESAINYNKASRNSPFSRFYFECIIISQFSLTP